MVEVPQSVTPAVGVNGVFDFPNGSEEFVQVNAFENLRTYMGWVAETDPRGGIDCLPIALYPHADRVSQQDWQKQGIDWSGLANYNQPSFSDDQTPKILLAGDAAGYFQVNLNFDVLAHEFGHHIFFRRIQDLSDSESLQLHEGLSDYLVFAMTGDACLAETICGPGSDCLDTTVGVCLRTAANPYRYNGEYWSALTKYHTRSQLISGTLWDLATEGGLGHPTVAHLVLKSADYLLRDANYENFYEAMHDADAELFNAANTSAIEATFQNRGFSF